VAKAFMEDERVRWSNSFVFCGVAKRSSMNLFPVEVGVLLPLAGASRSRLSLRFAVLLGVCATFGSIFPSAVLLLLLGVCDGNRSKIPRSFPFFCGVGPIIETLIAGVPGTGDGTAFWSNPELFCFRGVVAGGLLFFDGVWAGSSSALRFLLGFGDVGIAAFPDNMSRILLYSLYFEAFLLVSSKPSQSKS
jgi:hypothetical protein